MLMAYKKAIYTYIAKWDSTPTENGFCHPSSMEAFFILKFKNKIAYMDVVDHVHYARANFTEIPCILGSVKR
jgi:hypothetical protein